MSIFTDTMRMRSGSDIGELTLVSELVKPGHVLLSCSHLGGVTFGDGLRGNAVRATLGILIELGMRSRIFIFLKYTCIFCRLMFSPPNSIRKFTECGDSPRGAPALPLADRMSFSQR